ncbi:MAG: hypothetical protein JWQ23_3319 [Herminiimonas sp.]|jgi:hypothetical protein|nr:hypothetical protein [Herminiimonas sp.]
MQAVDCERPAKLYRYSERRWLERALTAGEFRLRPMLDDSLGNPRLRPFQGTGARVAATAGYLTLSLAREWDPSLFGEFGGADCCLVIHNTEEFGERVHRAVQRVLPTWAGIDAAISYGIPSPLGKAFSRTSDHAKEKEWLFAWRPTQPTITLNPIVIQIGSMEDIAELREKAVS